MTVTGTRLTGLGAVSRRTVLVAAGTLAGAALLGTAGCRKVVQPDAKFTGPIPVGPGSVPWGSAMDGGARQGLLKHYDYVEEEYFLSGSCAVYGPAGTVEEGADLSPMEYPNLLKPLGKKMRSGVPYKTRATVLRPREMDKFSGVVHMIPLHNLNGTSRVEKNLLRGGDVWIGLEVCGGTRFGVEERPSGGVANLLRYNSERYDGLRLPSGKPEDWPDLQPGRLGEAFKNMDFGKRDGEHSKTHAIFRQEISRSYAQGPDIMSDAAALIRQGGADSPLGDHPIRWILTSGSSGQSTVLQPYIDYHHDAATQRYGRVPYDGYMIRVGSMPASRPQGSALVLVQSEAEALDLSADYIDRYKDTDDPKFRYYEIPGVGHGLSARPKVSSRIGGVVPEGIHGISDTGGASQYEPYDKISLPVIWGMWANMVEWLDKGTPMPRSDRITRDPASPDGIARDDFGNAKGGIRLPWMDHPDARYVGVISENNPLEGGMMRFSEPQMKELYGSDEAWRAKLTESLQQLAKQRWIADEDIPLMLERGVTPALALGFVESGGE
ncbi:MAG: alpha/beta hydrolase domain-containing protein [Novosphingobium sp.]|nr:alpha/beta hydrolase domain-containing protein [Novosphingobium sp.]